MDPRIKLAAELAPEEVKVAGNAADAVRCFRLISFASQRLRYLYDQRLRGEGITTQQGVLLTFVRAHGNPTLGEVARSMATTHQNAKQLALAVEKKGLIRIVPDAQDKRVKRLQPTSQGKRGWEHRNADDFAAVGAWFATLTRAEQRALASTMVKLIGGLE